MHVHIFVSLSTFVSEINYMPQMRRMKEFFADNLQNVGKTKNTKQNEEENDRYRASDQGDSTGNDTEDTSDAVTPPPSC